jgi:CO/xanthine dehydrogenase FAD-binding subunit
MMPHTVEEALEILGSKKGEARIIAGGTDLIVDLKARKEKIHTLVDISRIPELKGIFLEKSIIHIGAMVTFQEVGDSKLIRERATALSEACLQVGSSQIRNLGTLVGNIVRAQPAADGAIALLSLRAEATIVTRGEKRIVPIEGLYSGPGRSKVDSSSEIVTEVRFSPLEKDEGSAFLRLSKRRALSLPTLNAAVAVKVAKDKDAYVFERISIFLGPVSPIPFRARRAEEILKHSLINPEVIREAAIAASEDSHPRDSLRGGKEYRKEMVRYLAEEGIKKALSRVELSRHTRENPFYFQ